MLTSNTEILRRLDALEKQWNDCQAEIELRMKQQRADNDGYVITQGQGGKYSLVSQEFLVEVLTERVNAVNRQIRACRCEEK